MGIFYDLVDTGVTCGDPPELDCRITGEPTGIMCPDTVDYTCDVCCTCDGSPGLSTCGPDGNWSVPEMNYTRE